MIDLKDVSDLEMARSRALVLNYPWESADAYGMWLAQTFHIVNHSTRLVALAGACVALDKNDLHARFIDHSREERGHQLVCESDLRAIGGRRVEDFPCLAPSAALYQVQYYWIQHRGPISFFGYVLALECLATHFGKQVLARVVAAHGVAAAKFLNLHTEEDVGHTAKAFKQLALFSAPERELVRENLELSTQLYRLMLSEAGERVRAGGQGTA